MRDSAGNELSVGQGVLYLNAGTSTSWLVWGEVDSFTPKKVRIKDHRGALVLRDPRSVVRPAEKVVEPKSVTLGSREYPGTYVTVTGPEHVEMPAQLRVRMLDRDYEDVVLWWHYDKQGNDTRTLAEGKGRHD